MYKELQTVKPIVSREWFNLIQKRRFCKELGKLAKSYDICSGRIKECSLKQNIEKAVGNTQDTAAIVNRQTVAKQANLL